MHVDLCWFIIPWSSLMWPKDYLNMCHIFYYNFSVIFLQSTWIRPQKNLPNQDSCCDITCQSPSTKHYHFKRKGHIVSATVQCLIKAKLCHNSIPQIHLYYLSFAGVLYHAIVREHLALTVQHNLVFWNDNVYWMVIDKWCHNKNLGLEDFLWAYQINRKIIKYMAHI